MRAGDYTSVRNINEVENSSYNNGYCHIRNLKNEVNFYFRGDGEAVFPSMYFRDCSYLSFDNITFKRQETQKKVYTNIAATNGYYNFKNCKFYNTNTPAGQESKHFSIWDGAVVYLDGTTFGGNVDIGFKCSVNASATFVGKNVATDVKKVFYTEHGGVINVIHPFNANSIETDYPNSTPNLKFNKRSKTVPDVRGVSQGQIIEAFNPYNGPQYYISDGNNGWSIVDQYNIHGDSTKTPDFTGQFSYNKANKSVKFAVGSSSSSDWVDISSLGLSSGLGVKFWGEGGSYNYGDVIYTSSGKTFKNLGNSFTYTPNSAVDTFSGRQFDSVFVGGNKLINLDPYNIGVKSFYNSHSRNENSQLPSTNKEINSLGCFTTYYDRMVFKNQPTKYGQLINLPCRVDDSSESMQLWIEQNSGQIYSRGGNGDSSVADRKFTQVYPNDFDNVDVLLFDWVYSTGDARERNIRLRKTFNNYKVITFYLALDNDTTYLYPCKFDVSEYRMALKLAKRATPAPKSYIIGKKDVYWSLRLDDWVLGSDNLNDITHSENCRIMAITGWPRKFDLD